MINDIFRSFFRTLGRILAYIFIGGIIAYFGSMFMTSSVKASVVDSYAQLKWNKQQFSSWDIYLGAGTNTFNFNVVAKTNVSNEWLKASMVYCINSQYTGISNEKDLTNGYIKNIKTISSQYPCTYANGHKGHVNMTIFEFYVTEEASGEFTGNISMYNDSVNVQLIDFFVDNSNFAKIDDYASLLLIENNSKIINQNTTIIGQNDAIMSRQQETNDKLTETNDKLDKTNDAINKEDSDTTSSKCGVICKLKGIFTGIIELPVKIITLLIDALKSLFIPENTDFITDFVDSIESKLGFIAEVPISIIEFCLDLAKASWEEVTSVSFPTISIFGYNFWQAQEIDITEGIKVFKPFKYITDCLCVVLCARTLNRWRENFTGGNS